MVISRASGLAFSLATAAALSGCGGGGGIKGDSTEAGGVPSGYRLVWSDEFNSGTVLSNTWTYDVGAPLLGGTVWGNAEQQFYTSDPSNVRIENGALLIQPVAGLPSVAPTNLNLVASSARVKTDTNTFYSALGNSPYGFYEIKADIPCVAGAWPAIWMMGKTGDWPARGELDIMEWFGKYFAAEPDQIQSGVHMAAFYGSTSKYQKLAWDGVCTGFHRFQLHWEATKLTFAVDDQTIFTYDKPANATADTWPFDQPAHLLMNVAVGGNLGGSVKTADIANMTMRVDYVKVWQP